MKKHFKKLCVLISAVFSITVFAVLPSSKASALSFDLGFDVFSDIVCLKSLDTGDVIYTKNPDKRLAPASLTKIMTCAIVLEHFKDDIGALSTTYVSGPSSVYDELYLTGCSTADIRINEKVSYKDLLYALMLRSACEAANILAYNIGGGSIQNFLDEMNAKAAELGCTDTHFSNAHGLFPDNHYTTANDMAKITEYAMSLPMFNEISCAATYTMEATSYHPEPREIAHTNFMLSPSLGGEYYYPYVKGIKTGTTEEAGRCLVSTASKDGYNYLLITLGAPQKNDNGENVFYNFIDHKNIYEWAFNNLEYRNLINPTEEIGEVKLRYGKEAGYVIVRPASDYSQIWLSSIDTGEIDRDIELYEDVVAPVKKGQVLGTITLSLDGQYITTIDLVAAKDVNRSEFSAKMDIAGAFYKSSQFKTALKLSLGLFVIYTLAFIIYKTVRQANRRSPGKYTRKK